MKRECGKNPQQYPLLWCLITLGVMMVFEIPATVEQCAMGRLQKPG